MNDLTICLAYYRNHGMLVEQCRRLRALPAELRDHIRLIVVDDGSAILQADEKELPEFAKAATHEEAGVPFELYRMMVNVRWNQDACRNLAVHHAVTDWVLLTDMDHMPHAETINHLVHGSFNVKMVYKFSRVTWEPGGRMTPYKPHPNSWFMTRKMFHAIGGYDESFAGYYGTDGDFKERVWARLGEEPQLLNYPLIRVPRETIPDASTTTYTRKGDRQDEPLKDLRRRRNATPGWQTKRLTFPWERVA